MSVQPTPQRPTQPAGRGAPPARTRRSGRARFWAGFVIGFALLALASCGGAAVALGLNRLTLAELRGDIVWTPPTLIPTPTAPPEGATPSAPAAGGRFSVGQTVYNVTGSRVNVRRTPGHLGKTSADVLAQLSPGDAMTILGETTQADNLTWWRVNFQGNEGWVAEATSSGVEILGVR